MVRRKTKVIIILLILIMTYIGINNITIFEAVEQSAEGVFNVLVNRYNPENTDICILKFGQVTGAGWYVEQSTNENLEGKYACLSSICNPRVLKENEDFSLDYMARYVVSIKKTDKTVEIDDETVKVLYPKEMIITDYYDENKKIKFNDLNDIAKIYALVAVFVPSLRLSY